MTGMDEDDTVFVDADNVTPQPAQGPWRPGPPPPIRVDSVQLAKALQPVVDALVEMNKNFARFAPAVEALGREMERAREARVRRLKRPMND